MSDFINAPWTDEQVAALNRWQASEWVHPFTCGRRGDGKHRIFHGDTGTLLATNEGWICRDCDFTQDWAHGFMAADPPPDPFAEWSQSQATDVATND